MIYNILKFLFFWLVLFVFSSILVALSSTALPNLSLAFIFFSFFGAPIASFMIVRNSKNKRLTSVQSIASNQARKDYLRRRFLERERLIDAVDRHRGALTRNLERAIKKNDYGAVTADQTDLAISEFIASIDIDTSAIPEHEAKELIFEQLDFRKASDAEIGFQSDAVPIDGHDFEKWVADSLVAFDWKAETTGGSGDQGIDVLAEKTGVKIGIQCKLYSSPVGNKAVQEAHAGKAYYNLDVAAVLTNAGFTSSAKDLATMTGVLLLSHHDIPNLDRMVSGDKP